MKPPRGSARPERQVPVPQQHATPVPALTLLNPVRHYTEIVRAVFLKSAGPSALWPQFLALFVMGTAILAFSASRFRKTPEARRARCRRGAPGERAGAACIVTVGRERRVRAGRLTAALSLLAFAGLLQISARLAPVAFISWVNSYSLVSSSLLVDIEAQRQ